MIHTERRGRMELITIDRQDRRNAVDTEACDAIADAVDAAVAGGARSIVLTGAGRNFCAGADLTGVHNETFRAALLRALDCLSTAPIVTIAAVHGPALGAGTQLAIACDLRVAAPDTRFGIPAAKLGLVVDHWTVRRLTRCAGFGTAQAMLLAAEEVDGEAAVRLGLAQRTGDLDAALEWAGNIAGLAPLTIAGHKLALNRVDAERDPAVDLAIRVAWASDDVGEGMTAFRERRPPDFQGR